MRAFTRAGSAAPLRSPRAPDIRSLAQTWTALKPSPIRGRGTALAVDEVRMDKSVRCYKPCFRSDIKTPLSTLHSPLCLFGEGGPLAVDEVTCSPAPLREAFYITPISAL